MCISIYPRREKSSTIGEMLGDDNSGDPDWYHGNYFKISKKYGTVECEGNVRGIPGPILR